MTFLETVNVKKNFLICLLYYHTSKQSQNTGGYRMALISLQESFYRYVLRGFGVLLESFYFCVLPSDSSGCCCLISLEPWVFYCKAVF